MTGASWTGASWTDASWTELRASALVGTGRRPLPPAGAVRSADPAGLGGPGGSFDPADPADPADPGDPGGPGGSFDPADPADPADPGDPGGPGGSFDPGRSFDRGGRMRPLGSTEPRETVGGGTTGLSPESRALHAAALLGAGRRAGLRPARGPVPRAPEARDQPVEPSEPVASRQAVHLLELLLGGSLGRGHEVGPLIQHWFTLAAGSGRVLPHPLLVPVLRRATADRSLQTVVAPTLGSRGRWLAARNPEWAWAVDAMATRAMAADAMAAPAMATPAAAADAMAAGRPGADPTTAGAGRPSGSGAEPSAADAMAAGGPGDADGPAPDRTGLEPDGFLALDPDRRLAAFTTLRRERPPAGVALLHLVWTDLAGPDRAALLDTMTTGLGPHDEPLLERALDDRARAVRHSAVALLERLPGSARAARCTAWLAPLVERTGRIRSRLTVAYPAPPAGDQLRDLPPPPPGPPLTPEAAWLRALVAGTPLGWWEATLGDSPRTIVARSPEAHTDLLAGWRRAAAAQDNLAWAEALLRERPATPELLALAGHRLDPALVVSHLAAETTVHERMALANALVRPWSPALAAEVLAFLRSLPNPDLVVSMLAPVLTEALPATALPTLTAWLDRVDRADHQALHRSLRRIVQLLSTRISISEAFA